MTTLVHVPAAFRISAIDRFTQQIVGTNSAPKDNHYILDFGKLDFIDGSGYTVLSNTLAWLKYHSVKVTFRNFSALNKNGIKYLDDCGFFRFSFGKPLSKDSRIRGTTLPCMSVESARAFAWIERRLSPWLEYELDTSYSSLSSMRTCIKELFNNIKDHSAQNTGFVHAQHYPNLRQIRITVSDFGVGIPTTIRGRFGPMSDGAAIKMASQEGVTAQSRPSNMGAGLNYLIDCVTNNRGSVLIHSLSGNMSCYLDKRKQVRHASIGRGSYPGTLVDITLDTRLFVGDDDERGEVEW